MSQDSACVSKYSAITSRSEGPTTSFHWEIQECSAIIHQNGGTLKSSSFAIPGVEGKLNILLTYDPPTQQGQHKPACIQASVEGEGTKKGQKLAGKLMAKNELHKKEIHGKFGCEKSGSFVEQWKFTNYYNYIPWYEGCWSLEATITAPGKIAVTEGRSQEITTSTFTCQPLLDNPKHSDVIIRCGDKTFRCHKAILSMRCEVFDRMFESGMMETAGGEVTVTDVSAEMMEMLLEFIYTGEVRDRAAYLDELFYAGHKYLLMDLVIKTPLFFLD